MRIYICVILLGFLLSSDIDVDEIIKKVDDNLFSKNRKLKSKMIVHGKRMSRTIESESWIIGTDSAYTEYISPPREAGTKMLKIDNVLLTYTPRTDRVIQISGHMLNQSVMGSDMSYNDIMEDKPLQELYTQVLEGSEIIDGRDCYVVYLEAIDSKISYPKRRAWVDKEMFLPLREELYAKSGKLLKSTNMSDIRKVQGRWFPFKFVFKDELKTKSKGTEWIVIDVEFNIDMSENKEFNTKLSRANLSK